MTKTPPVSEIPLFLTPLGPTHLGTGPDAPAIPEIARLYIGHHHRIGAPCTMACKPTTGYVLAVALGLPEAQAAGDHDAYLAGVLAAPPVVLTPIAGSPIAKPSTVQPFDTAPDGGPAGPGVDRMAAWEAMARTVERRATSIPVAVTLEPPTVDYGAGPKPVDQAAAERLSREAWDWPDVGAVVGDTLVTTLAPPDKPETTDGC